MTPGDVAWLLALGLMAGWVGGLIGVGGSIVMIPGLSLWFGGGALHLHQAAAMLVNFFVVAPAVLQHRRAGAIAPRVVRWTIPGAVVGAVGGVGLATLPVFRDAGQGWLQLLFAAFLVYVVYDNAQRLRSRSAAAARGEMAGGREDATPALLVGCIGVPIGLLGGLLGVGGGIVAVPSQQYLLRMPLRNAIANSAATILWSSAAAAALKSATLTVHRFSWLDAVHFSALLIPGAMLGGWLGGWLVHRWPVKWVRVVLIGVLAYAAVRLAMQGIENVWCGGAV